jgi:hypothetical protein
LETQIAYFDHHQRCMLYKTCHQAGLFCGSGVVEAGCARRHRPASQKLRHVLDRSWRQKRLGFALRPPRQSLGRMLESPASIRPP